MSIAGVCAAITGSRAALPEVLHAVYGTSPAGCLPFPAASAIRPEAALPVTAPGTALARRRAQREGQIQDHLTERAVVRPPGIRSPPAAAGPAGPGASASCALSTSLRIFPVAVRGKVLVNAQRAGI